MRVLLIQLRKRPGSDEVSRRETLLHGDALHIGRGVAMEINLADIDIDYHHATLAVQNGVLTLSGVGTNQISVGGREVPSTPLGPGAIASVKRFQFRAEPARDGADYVVVLEESTELATRKPLRDRRTVAEVLPSRRRLAWVATLVILGLFVAWPLSTVLTRVPPSGVVVEAMVRANPTPAAPFEASWTAGPLSRAHQLVENDCGACHQRPFEQTTNAACLTCHATATNHANPVDHPVVGLDQTRCTSCHAEHKGGTTPTQTADAGCVTCHADLKAVSAKSDSPSVRDFGTAHPAFAPSVLQGVQRDLASGGLMAVYSRVTLSDGKPLTEQSGLKFPHNKHLVTGGVEAPGGRRQLDCASCHVPEADGALMRAIEQPRDCAGCHKMQFNAEGTIRELPHAKEDEVARIIVDAFRSAALGGNVASETAPASVKARRLPGRAITDSERAEAITWADGEATRAMDAVFADRLCGTCHVAKKSPDLSGVDRWRVYPALLQRVWMPKAHFSHAPHAGSECGTCHKATASAQATDVLMPGIETCRTCHQGGTAAQSLPETIADLVQQINTLAGNPPPPTGAPVPVLPSVASGAADSSCTACHAYHLPGQTPMSPDHAALWAQRLAAEQASPKPVAPAPAPQ